jgi:hypothetical protein
LQKQITQTMRRTKINDNGLNELEERFLNHYLNNGFNATQAYISIKPKASYETAKTEGNLMAKKPQVVMGIEKRLAEERQKEEIKKSEIVTKLKTLMYECITDADRANLLKTIDILNKMGGHYQHNVDITSKGDKINITLNLGEDNENE